MRFYTRIRNGLRQSHILKRHITHFYRVLKSIMRTVSSELHYRTMENFIEIILLNARFSYVGRSNFLAVPLVLLS